MESLVGLLFFINVFVNDSCYSILPADSTAGSLLNALKQSTSFEHFDSLVYQIDLEFKRNKYPFYSIRKIKSDSCTGLIVHSGLSLGDSIKIIYSISDNQYEDATVLHKFESSVQKILEKEQNTGYPFSRIIPSIHSFKSSIPIVHAELDKGPLIVIDSLVVKSENPPKLHIIKRYSGLTLPFTYNFKKIEESVQSLENSGVLESTAPASILFSEQGSTLFLYLNKKQRVFADLIIGVNSNNKNQTILTGEVNLILKNVFGYAESVALLWRAPAPQQQFLNLKLDFPFMFRTPFGWSSDVRLFRQDSTFANFSGQVTCTYFFSPSVSAGLGLQRETSAAPGLVQNGVSSFSADYSFIKLLYKKMNGSGVSRKGFFGSTEINVGLLRESDNELNRLKFQMNIESDQKLFLNHKVYNRISIFHLGGENLLLNESFRTGGVGSVRGFNEWLFFASTALIGVAEYRFFLDANTFFKAFYDGAWQKITFGELGYFQGMGAGLALPVGTGILHIDIGIGKFPGLPINLRDTRLHVGISAGF